MLVWQRLAPLREKSIAVFPFENLSVEQGERVSRRRHPGRSADQPGQNQGPESDQPHQRDEVSRHRRAQHQGNRQIAGRGPYPRGQRAAGGGSDRGQCPVDRREHGSPHLGGALRPQDRGGRGHRRRTGHGNRRSVARHSSLRTKKSASNKSRPKTRTPTMLYLRALPYEQGPDTLAPGLPARRATLFSGDCARSELRPRPCAPRFHLRGDLSISTNRSIPGKTKARSEAETALRLQSGLGEAPFRARPMRLLDRRGLRARAGANSPSHSSCRLTTATSACPRRRHPSPPGTLGGIARWRYERSQRARPAEPEHRSQHRLHEQRLRRWPEAAARGAALAADGARFHRGANPGRLHRFQWKGDPPALKKALAAVSPGRGSGWHRDCHALGSAPCSTRDFPGPGKVLADSPLTGDLLHQWRPDTEKLPGGCTALAQGDRAGRRRVSKPRARFREAAVKEAPDAAERHANLGLCYAFMGRKDEAIREGRRAVELKPESKDAYDGAIMNCYLALIYARVGENDQAIPLIEQLSANSRRRRQRQLQHHAQRSEDSAGNGTHYVPTPPSRNLFRQIESTPLCQ